MLIIEEKIPTQYYCQMFNLKAAIDTVILRVNSKKLASLVVRQNYKLNTYN